MLLPVTKQLSASKDSNFFEILSIVKCTTFCVLRKANEQKTVFRPLFSCKLMRNGTFCFIQIKQGLFGKLPYTIALPEYHSALRCK